MQRFWNPENIAPKVLVPGVTAKIASGEKIMLSLITLAPNVAVPTHSHPHEQMGMMVSGTMEYTIADETRVLSGNELFFVPGGVPHAVKAGPAGAVALDAFSPPREEYREAGGEPFFAAVGDTPPLRG
jgi:quercetin dioxygenase-like cupin family protein